MNISITDSQGEWLLEILEREMFPDQMEQLMIEASMDAFKDDPQAFEIAPGDTVTGYLDPADPEVAKAKWLGLALDTRIEKLIDFFGPKEPDVAETEADAALSVEKAWEEAVRTSMAARAAAERAERASLAAMAAEEEARADARTWGEAMAVVYREAAEAAMSARAERAERVAKGEATVRAAVSALAEAQDAKLGEPEPEESKNEED